MRASTAIVFLAGLIAPFTLAAPTAEEVLTPGGYRTTNVHEIPDGASLAHVGAEIHVVASNGTILKKVTAGGPTPVKAAAAALKTGWVTFASWRNTGASPIASFTTNWKVPPVPKTQNGQTIFLFNSIEPNSGNAILQPVLQYGGSAAGGGAYWAAATWYLDPSNTFFTKPVKVAAGSNLDGIITLTGSSGSQFHYTSSFTNIAGTNLKVANASQLTWATETLEAYAVKAITDYPAGSTVFTNINLKLKNGAVPSVSWATSDDAADGLKTTVNTNGATNAKITIKY
ncbi:hypothetical protein DFH06DRAFT_1139354 [Mycena polygramma]|nr:hypothetical protein DFH06DRAFT_1342662 [Mycena polygramma]KAJ7635819.1 hypothetical protein DFH06DRAFT_1139354 [Mycena polygramma]